MTSRRIKNHFTAARMGAVSLEDGMRIIVVGVGKVGLELTRQLSGENQVTIIDEDAQLIEHVINIYDVMGVCGN